MRFMALIISAHNAALSSEGGNWAKSTLLPGNGMAALTSPASERFSLRNLNNSRSWAAVKAVGAFARAT